VIFSRITDMVFYYWWVWFFNRRKAQSWEVVAGKLLKWKRCSKKRSCTKKAPLRTAGPSGLLWWI